jgi:hypothetical protein
MREVLPCEDVVKAVERRQPLRVPMMIHQWNGAGAFGDLAGEVEAIQREYPQDWLVVVPRFPANHNNPADPNDLPGYAWLPYPPPAGDGAARGHDTSAAIPDWSRLDEILGRFPDPGHPAAFNGLADQLRRDAQGRYTAFHWWFCFYERLWSLRGMENILCDFYENPEAVHRLMDALSDFYAGWIRRAGRELGVNAIYTTDDIGMQTGPMFSPDVFRTFFKPRYKRLIAAAHESGMHFWLHTCGDVRPFLEDFIEIGLDVIHPIQKYTMDEREVAARFGGRLSFWLGMDVQQILPRGTPDDVRREVRFLIDTFDRPEGGCMITAGNGITPDVPVENLRAFYDETYEYGLRHRAAFRR